MTTPSPKFAEWAAGSDSRIAITGASGWIGRAMIHVALQAGADPAQLRLLGSRVATVQIGGRILPVSPLTDAADLGAGDWLLIHAAVAGPDRTGGDWTQAAPVNDGLLGRALALARTGAVRRLVFTSSGAAGVAAPSAYGAMKRRHEDAVRQSGLATLIPRVFNLGGPYLSHPDRYALSDFIRMLMDTGRIHIAAPGTVLRSYVHVLELARVLFDAALDRGMDGAPFDTAGLEVVEMAQLAQAVAAALGRADAPIGRTAQTGQAEDRYVGDGRVYQATLARSGGSPAPLAAIIRDTAAYITRNA